MRYRKTCALYDEANMGNPGNVPWCSDKGLELDCENCTRPDKTNADRIRSMSDEELAEWVKLMVCKYRSFGNCPMSDWCEPDRGIAEWLKSPVEAEDGT